VKSRIEIETASRIRQECAAIIAILAAILFPVFAQAKLAAKATSALSNAKQLDLAEIMYSGDADDIFVPADTWNTGSDPLCFGSNACFSTWTWLILPYTKNGAILNCPFSQPQYTGGFTQTLQDTFTPTYGYDYDALAPWYPQNGQSCASIQSVSGSAPQNPSNLPMVMAKFSDHDYPAGANAYNVAWGFFGYGCNPGGFGTPILNTTIDAPECDTINAYCVGNWGTGSQWANPLIAGGGAADGMNTGGNTLLATNDPIGAFTDGHAKKMPAGAWAVGTNWNPNLPNGNLVVGSPNNYLWWVNPSAGN